MSVYVDSFYTPYRNMLMCHMLADTAEELHVMADTIGIKRKWFQGDHYDLPSWLHVRAVAEGAALVRSTDLVRRLRAAGLRRSGGASGR